ncbi:hypothetical protein C8P63_11731 [Melghirimyces profundicolus]|uniref:Uncharacterized protein n=1 Tax=Melghirimyces profundicolus TaxID=1242148 RepID=A0A2T6BQF9_9BACL|nr:hypothetical protein C8P63_11731 [Melghirimyces profundicolus]
MGSVDKENRIIIVKRRPKGAFLFFAGFPHGQLFLSGVHQPDAMFILTVEILADPVIFLPLCLGTMILRMGGEMQVEFRQEKINGLKFAEQTIIILFHQKHLAENP